MSFILRRGVDSSSESVLDPILDEIEMHFTLSSSALLDEDDESLEKSLEEGASTHSTLNGSNVFLIYSSFKSSIILIDERLVAFLRIHEL